jgi:hypothetical protein
MALYLTYHPWTRGTMARDQVLGLIGGLLPDWQAKGLVYRTYVGTEEAAEGYSLFEAPSKAALIRAFEESRIPYLSVHEVWEISPDDLKLSVAAGKGRPQIL